MRILDRRHGQLLREHRAPAAAVAIARATRIARRAHRPSDASSCSARRARRRAHRRRSASRSIAREGEVGVRRILGVLSLRASTAPPPSRTPAPPRSSSGCRPTASCAATSSAAPPPQLTLRQVDPLIRELTHYRDLISAHHHRRGGHHREHSLETRPRAQPAAPRRHGRTSRDAAASRRRAERCLRSTSSPTLVSDELTRRADRLLERRVKQAGFRDADKTLDTFDFDFNKKMNRRLVFELATGASSTAARGRAVPRPARHRQEPSRAGDRPAPRSSRGYHVRYREAHVLLEELADATHRRHPQGATRRLTTVPLLIIDDLGMRKLPLTAAEDLLEIIMRRHERAARSSPPIAPSRTGASCSATRRPSPPARSPAPPRPCAQVRTAELAHASATATCTRRPRRR